MASWFDRLRQAWRALVSRLGLHNIRFQGLTFTLFSTFFHLCTLVLLFSYLIIIFASYQYEKTVIVSQQHLIAQNATDHVREYLHDKFTILSNAILLGNLAKENSANLKLTLNKIMGAEASFNQLAILNPQYHEITQLSRLSKLDSSSFYGRIDGKIRALQKPGDQYISPVYVDKITSEPMVIMGVPINNIFGDFKGVLLAEVKLKYIWELIDNLKIGKKGLAYVVNDQGVLLAFKDISRVLKAENLKYLKQVDIFTQGDTKTHTTNTDIVKGILNTWVVSNHVHLGMPNWAVVVELPATEAYENVIRGLKMSFGAVFLSLLLVLLASILISKKITEPIIRLRDATREISRGNMNLHIDIHSRNEIGELADSFNQMTVALEKTTVSRDALLVEISERIKVEEALTESEEEFRLAFENAKDAIFWADTSTGLILKCNHAAEALLETPREALIGRPAISIYPEEKRTFYEGEFKRRISQKITVGDEAEIKTKTGKLIPVEINASVVSIRGKTIIQGIFRNLSERKQAELEKERLQTKLLQAQKLESIGQLAAGIAHEINTPTQYVGDNLRFLQESLEDIKPVISGYTSLLDSARQGEIDRALVAQVETSLSKADLPYLSTEVPKAIQQAQEGIKRVTTIVRAMKDFAHPDSSQKTLVNLNEAISSTLIVARNEWKYIAEVVTDFDLQLPAVPCFAGEFNQVILNLIVNAAHTISDVTEGGGKGKGQITISTRMEGAHAEIRVADTGTGIPEHLLTRIFDPFFTTKEVGKGTGQGLTIAHNIIVNRHQGSIHVTTRSGQGTTFIIRLPLQDDGPIQNEPKYPI
ncbi:MAG: ATP-binding protein [candidate division FCPU426 bacterium]